MFFDEWGSFIDSQTLTSGPLIVMGDLIFHVYDASNVDASRFRDCVNSVGMVMHVRGPTHKKGHTLDIVLTRSADEHLIRNVTVADMGLSDHYAVSYILNICQQHTGMHGRRSVGDGGDASPPTFQLGGDHIGNVPPPTFLLKKWKISCVLSPSNLHSLSACVIDTGVYK